MEVRRRAEAARTCIKDEEGLKIELKADEDGELEEDDDDDESGDEDFDPDALDEDASGRDSDDSRCSDGEGDGSGADSDAENEPVRRAEKTVEKVNARSPVQKRKAAAIAASKITEEVNDKGRGYFRAQGFDVVSCARITPARQFAEVAPAELYAWIKANVPRQAEAVFIGGNGLRAIGVIESLEKALGRPVLTANQVAFWQALRLVGMTSKVRHHGRIFTIRGNQ